MSVVRPLLGLGNGKLGQTIFTFSLPPVVTCPGRSQLCEANCYARQGNFARQNVRDRMADNLAAACQGDFESRVLREMVKRCVLLCRWHVSGDFFNEQYAAKCLNIFRRARRVRFWLYTRSWRAASILP